jgi:hypothetical protein
MTAISQSSNAALIVQKQLDAYNARDIDTFMAMWSDDAQLFAHPATLLANGAAEIRERHLARFAEANLFGKLICRMEVGDMVVDREVVTRSFPEGPGRVDVIMIYQVSGNKICKAWAKMGDPIFDATA